MGLENRENQIARTLSTGQKRRLSLAGLILIKPNIILADEPTNGLDELGSNLCISIFEDLKQNNSSSIIVATHDKNIIDWCQEKISLENLRIYPFYCTENRRKENKNLKNSEFVLNRLQNE